MPLTFIDWIFILQLLICLLVLTVFWWSLQGFLYKISWSLQIDTVLLFSGWMVLFLFLGYLLWLGLPVLCWIKVMTVFLHPCLLPIFREKTFSFVPLRATLKSQMVKSLPAVQETQFQSLGQKTPWRRGWLPSPVFLPGEFHGQRSLAGNSPWGLKELDMTDALTHTCIIKFVSCRFLIDGLFLCWGMFSHIYMTSNTMLN